MAGPGMKARQQRVWATYDQARGIAAGVGSEEKGVVVIVVRQGVDHGMGYGCIAHLRGGQYEEKAVVAMMDYPQQPVDQDAAKLVPAPWSPQNTTPHTTTKTVRSSVEKQCKWMG
jgi:hypothetical protein